MLVPLRYVYGLNWVISVIVSKSSEACCVRWGYWDVLKVTRLSLHTIVSFLRAEHQFVIETEAQVSIGFSLMNIPPPPSRPELKHTGYGGVFCPDGGLRGSSDVLVPGLGSRCWRRARAGRDAGAAGGSDDQGGCPAGWRTLSPAHMHHLGGPAGTHHHLLIISRTVCPFFPYSVEIMSIRSRPGLAALLDDASR